MCEIANGKYKISEMLLYYMGPILFTATDKDGQLYLGQMLDEGDNYMLVPTSEKTVSDMKQKIVTMNKAFRTSDHAVYINSGIENRVKMYDVPDDDLPVEGYYCED